MKVKQLLYICKDIVGEIVKMFYLLYAKAVWIKYRDSLTTIAFNEYPGDNSAILNKLWRIFTQYEETEEQAAMLKVARTTYSWNTTKRWRISKEEYIQWYGKVEDGAFLN